jgi:hypothetical protein
MTATRLKEKEKAVNRLDSTMTPAQVARRKFKSALPRKPQNRILTPMQALGETFTLLDNFRGVVMAEKQSKAAALTVYGSLAYSLPKSTKLAHTIPVPEPGEIGAFCEAVLALEQKDALFLGVVFVQTDPDAENTAYKAVSFVAQFMSGPDAEARLLYAQKLELSRVQSILEVLKGSDDIQ